MSVYNKQVGGDFYKMPIQPVVFINKNNIPYCEGCIIKYACRHKKKGGRVDIEKLIHYAEMILERDYEIAPKSDGVFNFATEPESPPPEVILSNEIHSGLRDIPLKKIN